MFNVNGVVCKLNLNLEISLLQQSLNSDFYKLTLNNLCENLLFELGTSLGHSIFKFGLRGAQKYTNLQLMVNLLFKLYKRLSLDSVPKKWGCKHTLTFAHCPASTPESIAVVVISKCSL